MKVVCLGAGNVATHLIKGLYDKSFDIIQVYSRTQESASALAKEVDAVPVTDLKDIIDDADLYIFALKDSVLEGVASQIPSNNGLWIHTAGSVPMDVFSNYTTHYGYYIRFRLSVRAGLSTGKPCLYLPKVQTQKAISLSGL